MIRMCSASLLAILLAIHIAPSTCRPQRQFQGGFRPINALNRFPGDAGQDADRFPPPPPPPRPDRRRPDQQTRSQQPARRPKQSQRPRPPPPLSPVQPARDTRQRPSRPRSPPPARRPSSNQREAAAVDELPVANAFSAPSLFVRPEFNVFGNPIMFDPPMIDEEEELPDFRRAKPKQRKRPKTNLGPDLRPRLPVFGQPDAILEVTEELRSNDVNHETFVPLGVVNAGVLPLAVPEESKEPKSLGLFPPFAPF